MVGDAPRRPHTLPPQGRRPATRCATVPLPVQDHVPYHACNRPAQGDLCTTLIPLPTPVATPQPSPYKAVVPATPRRNNNENANPRRSYRATPKSNQSTLFAPFSFNSRKKKL